jgi:hypothetical protein
MLAFVAGFLLLPLFGCARISDRGITFSPPASGDRVADVEELVADEQSQRQDEDKAIRKDTADAMDAHRAQLDEALAALRGDTSAEADKIRGELKSTADDLRAGLDPTARLAALRDEAMQRAAALAAQAETNARKEAASLSDASRNALEALEARSRAQVAQLEKAVIESREGEIDWLEVFGISAGVAGGGLYGLNRYRNRTRKQEDEAPFVAADGTTATESQIVAAARALTAAARTSTPA